VVAIPTDNFGGWMICCAYVVRSGDEVSLTALREHLKKTVPSYMFPARWVAYDVLPQNPNGKIDRPRLKERFAQAENATSTPQGSNSNSNGVGSAGGTGPADGTFPISNRHASQV
jgi:acyl-coenzyme A synthetase/AMP-(fatty) acid ligase